MRSRRGHGVEPGARHVRRAALRGARRPSRLCSTSSSIPRTSAGLSVRMNSSTRPRWPGAASSSFRSTSRSADRAALPPRLSPQRALTPSGDCSASAGVRGRSTTKGNVRSAVGRPEPPGRRPGRAGASRRASVGTAGASWFGYSSRARAIGPGPRCAGRSRRAGRGPPVRRRHRGKNVATASRSTSTSSRPTPEVPARGDRPTGSPCQRSLRSPQPRTEEFPTVGHDNSPLAAIGFSPGPQLSRITPFPDVACLSRTLSPVVSHRWAWWSSRSTVAVARVFGMSSSNPAGCRLEDTATERFS